MPDQFHSASEGDLVRRIDASTGDVSAFIELDLVENGGYWSAAVHDGLIAFTRTGEQARIEVHDADDLELVRSITLPGFAPFYSWHDAVIERGDEAYWVLIPGGPSTGPGLVTRIGDDGDVWTASVPSGTREMIWADGALWLGTVEGLMYIVDS